MKPYLVLTILFIVTVTTSCQKSHDNASSKVAVDQVLADIKDVDIAEFKQLMLAPDAIILDVRTPEEIAEGKIPDAVELDYRSSNFKEEIAKLDKNKTYLVYCRSGGRSSKSCDMMKDLGFSSLVNLKGGYVAWDEAH